jgi:ribonuclease T1
MRQIACLCKSDRLTIEFFIILTSKDKFTRLGQLTAFLLVVLLCCGIAELAQARSSHDAIGAISARQLPIEAKATLALIQRGGPFPYAKDGSVFANREHRLPSRPRGYYREYTVKTPTTRDRGARRVIVGAPGEYYYTDDHYRSFRRIDEVRQ